MHTFQASLKKNEFQNKVTELKRQPTIKPKYNLTVWKRQHRIVLSPQTTTRVKYIKLI